MDNARRKVEGEVLAIRLADLNVMDGQKEPSDVAISGTRDRAFVKSEWTSRRREESKVRFICCV